MKERQELFNYLERKGVKLTGSENNYKLLYKLSKINGIDMNGNKSIVMKEFGISKNKIMAMARDTLEFFLNSGNLIVPKEFKYRKRNVYLHDGDAKANRNLWRESNKEIRNKKN
ncbi:hypothetical protein H5203_18890 [Pseudoalteromonas sp. SG41-1]|uniref:hypothetical protein n=1 Tax=Pseudoalteromonas sp. SG41-1 TaxID=2760979 RepID=UPI001602D78E|nr:hypothetical protein [Pseudoalteromonas sp. SG41-1]MBB1507536.1 hypothetical protein [Pseudoalteromonas sp. SG41-1]